MKWNQPTGAGGFRHPDDEQLVSFFDGELHPAMRLEVSAHVTSCWQCRARLKEMEAEIQAFLEARKEFLPSPEVLAEPPVEQFRERLLRHSAEQRSQMPLLRRAWGSVRRAFRPSATWMARHQRPALAVVVIAVVLVATFTDIFNNTLAAETVLLRARDYEIAHQPRSGEVALSAVHFERIDRRTQAKSDLGTLEVAHDSATSAFLLRAPGRTPQVVAGPQAEIRPALLQLAATQAISGPVLAYLAERRWTPEVSVPAFRRLLEDRGSEQSSARRDDDSIEVRYEFSSGHRSTITEARLRVDAAGYAARQVSILTADAAGQWEYRLTRQEQPPQLRTQQWAALFGAPGLPSTRVNAGTSALSLPPARITPLSYAQVPASEREVATAAALHQADTCLGEEIHIFPMSDGSLLVQGLVDRPEQRDNIRHRLAAVGFPLNVEIYLPSEVKRGQRLYDPPEGPTIPVEAATAVTVATLADFSSEQMPLHEKLTVYFSSRSASEEDASKRVAAFSNDVVSISRQTLLHAWALQQLEHAFNPTRVRSLPAASLQELERLRADHRRWIGILSRQEAELLAPFLDPAKPPPAAGPNPPDSASLVRLAEQQGMLVRALFTVSSAAPDADASLHRLMATLRQMER
jgi:hypothetical protein